MFRPNHELQICAGLSMVLLSIGGSWSMVSGSVVQFRIAGANFSVNEKLERVEEAKEILEDVTTELKRDPKSNRRRIQKAEQQLQLATPPIDETETKIQQDLDELGNLEGY